MYVNVFFYDNYTDLPVVIVDPTSQSVQVMQTVKFTTAVSGVGKENFIYQWRHNGDNIKGETSNTLILKSVAECQCGDYVCVVTNDYGDWITSDISRLSK